MPSRPRRAPAPALDAVEPATYVLEQRLLKAYARLLYAPDQCPEELMRAVWGPHLTERQMYGTETKPGKIGRLDEQLPEVIRLITRADEQDALAALLLAEAPDLVGAIRYLLRLDQGNAIKRRETDPRLKVNDDALCRAAGIGHLARADPGSFQPRANSAPAVPAPAPTPAPAPARRPRRVVWQPWHGTQLALGF